VKPVALPDAADQKDVPILVAGILKFRTAQHIDLDSKRVALKDGRQGQSDLLPILLRKNPVPLLHMCAERIQVIALSVFVNFP
jgi:hypothetical protein